MGILRTRQPVRTGATLVELLVALGIGAMALTIVLLAYNVFTTHTRQFETRSGQRKLAEQTLQLLGHELQQLFFMPGDSNTVVVLENTATNLVQLGFSRWLSAPRETLPAQRLERVTYTYVPMDGRPQLVRIIEGLTGPAASSPPATNWPGPLWPRLTVLLHDGQQWQTNWPSTAERAPAAAHIQLLAEPPAAVPAHEIIVVIPAGLSTTSRLDRLDKR